MKIHGTNCIPIIHYSNKNPEIILIANYRPPAKSFCLEFPGGYVESEDYEEEAKRETLEETGYIIEKIESIPNPVTYSDPWRSNESIHTFVGRVDGDKREAYSGQNLEEDENIRVYRLPLDKNLLKNINALAKQQNYVIEKNVWTTALGIVMKDILK